MTGRAQRRGSWARRLSAAALVFVGALAASPSEAQHTSSAARIAGGRVQRAAADTSVPLSGAWVILHRVGPDTAAPLDSTRTDARGRFRFAYRTTGSADAVYFASSSYAGIAYFTQPLTGASTERTDLELVVFDTSSLSRTLTVRGRHVIVSGPADDGRTVIEVFELSNDSSVTLVAGEGDAPTFTTTIPETATAFQARDSDVARDAISMNRGRVEVRAPIAPGLKQLAFSYQMPTRANTLRFPVERATPVLEVLAEEPMARVSGAGLIEVDPITIDGRGFRRFLAQDPPTSGVVTMEFPAAPKSTRQLYLVVVVLGVGIAMLFALARVAFRRR